MGFYGESSKSEQSEVEPASSSQAGGSTSHVDQEPNEVTCKRARGNRWKYNTAYFNFLADFRADHKGKNWSPKDVARKAGEAWRRLSNDQKKPYQEAALKNRKTGRGNKRGSRGKRNAKPARRRQRVSRRHRDTPYETDESEDEPPAKRRRHGKGGTGCICGMKHNRKGNTQGRTRTLGDADPDNDGDDGGQQQSDDASSYYSAQSRLD